MNQAVIKNFKLGAGPMSKEIIEILKNYSSERNSCLMLIASRNQVDSDSGYVCTTSELVEQLKSMGYDENLLWLCRDHCGPYFSDLDRGLTVDEAIVRCKKTILTDMHSRFKLIHIDVSRIKDRQLDYAKELIEYALSIDPLIHLEFGSEDNTGVDINSSIGRIETQLEFLEQYKNNIAFFVTQTGSLTKDQQVGEFDVQRNKKIGEQIRKAGFLFKEHNADYFTEDDVVKRAVAQVDSLNIAPQLGKIQTDLLKEYAPAHLWEKFSDYVYTQNYWQRWVSPGVTDKDIAVSVSGHYCFNSTEYKDITSAIDYTDFKSKLTSKIFDILDLYTIVSDKKIKEEEFQLRLKLRLEELRRRDPFIYR